MSLATFLVTALPRSRTAWIAAFFSGHDSFCFHERTRAESSMESLISTLEGCPETYAGNSDSALMLDQNGLRRVSGKTRVALIVRDVKDVRSALKRAYGMDLPGAAVDAFLDTYRLPFVQSFTYESLAEADGARALWEYCMPGLAWDQERYELFARLRIDLDPLVHEQEMRWFGSQQLSQ